MKNLQRCHHLDTPSHVVVARCLASLSQVKIRPAARKSEWPRILVKRSYNSSTKIFQSWLFIFCPTSVLEIASIVLCVHGILIKLFQVFVWFNWYRPELDALTPVFVNINNPVLTACVVVIQDVFQSDYRLVLLISNIFTYARWSSTKNCLSAKLIFWQKAN